MNVLEIQSINKSFKNKIVFENFSMSVKIGEIVCILGPSGIGKSTLLRCINGLEKIDGGKILIDGVEIKNKIQKNTNLNVGLIFQDFNLFPQYTVKKNITLPMTEVLRMPKEEAEKRAEKLLKQLDLIEKENSYPFELSGGEKQRVAIARSIAVDPKILCFDEPTSSLDPKLVKEVYNIIKNLSKNKKAILIVTHDVLFAEKIADRIIKL